MKEASARNNILPYLKQVGIIDDDGKTKERAKNGEMILNIKKFVRK